MKTLDKNAMALLKKASAVADFATLGPVLKLAEQRQTLAMEIQSLEQLLKDKKEALTNIDQQEFPELMESFGIDSFDSQGFHFSLETVLGVSSWSKPEQLDWLRENKHAGLIKSELTATLPKGKIKLAHEAVSVLQKLGIPTALKEYVHASTAKAWVKEMLSEGKPFPKEILSVYQAPQVKVTPLK